MDVEGSVGSVDFVALRALLTLLFKHILVANTDDWCDEKREERVEEESLRMRKSRVSVTKDCTARKSMELLKTCCTAVVREMFLYVFSSTTVVLLYRSLSKTSRKKANASAVACRQSSVTYCFNLTTSRTLEVSLQKRRASQTAARRCTPPCYSGPPGCQHGPSK